MVFGWLGILAKIFVEIGDKSCVFFFFFVGVAGFTRYGLSLVMENIQILSLIPN